MAVPFYMPEDDDHHQSSVHHQPQSQQPTHQSVQQQQQQPLSTVLPPAPPQQTPQQRYYLANGQPATAATVVANGQNHSAASATTQTPLQSPVSGELVQAIYDALYLLSNSVAGTPVVFPSPPASPSCAGYNTNNMHANNVFFSRIPTQMPRGRDDNMTPQRQQWHQPRHINMPRSRLNSTGSTSSADEFFDDEYTPSEIDYANHAIAMHRMSLEMATSVGGALPPFNEHYNNMDAREYLPEFTGQIPMRKKLAKKPEPPAPEERVDQLPVADDVVPKKEGPDVAAPKPKTNDQKFVWPTVVTAVVLAVGCGFYVTR